VSNLVKATGQHVEQKPAQELDWFERSGAAILGGEGHAALVDSEYSRVGDAHAMGVATEVAVDLLSALEGCLGVHDPLPFEECATHGLDQFRRYVQVASVDGLEQAVTKESAKQARRDFFRLVAPRKRDGSRKLLDRHGEYPKASESRVAPVDALAEAPGSPLAAAAGVKQAYRGPTRRQATGRGLSEAPTHTMRDNRP
jgi:hypothetical protein